MADKWIMNFIYQKIETEKLSKNRFHYAYLLVSNRKSILSDGRNDFIQDQTCTTVHAEISALMKIRYECKKSVDLVVIKLNKDGNIGKAKPCDHCLYMLHQSKVNIKNVYYSTIIDDQKYIIKEKFCKMINYNIHDKKVTSKSPRYKSSNQIFYHST